MLKLLNCKSILSNGSLKKVCASSASLLVKISMKCVAMHMYNDSGDESIFKTVFSLLLLLLSRFSHVPLCATP